MKINLPEDDDRATYKVRIEVSYAAYFFIVAKNQDDAEKIAEAELKKDSFDIVSESSHSHHTIEVEET